MPKWTEEQLAESAKRILARTLDDPWGTPVANDIVILTAKTLGAWAYSLLARSEPGEIDRHEGSTGGLEP